MRKQLVDYFKGNMSSFLFILGVVPMNLPLNTVSLDEFMQATFYKVPEGLTKSASQNDDDREMVSVVFEIKKIPARKLKVSNKNLLKVPIYKNKK